MKCLVLLFITFFAFALGDLYFDVAKEQWSSFKLTYQKDYPDNIENSYRFKIFLSNSIKILRHNQRYEAGLETYSMKMNQFGDLFTYEVVNLMNGLNETLVKEQWNNLDDVEFLPPANIDLPPSIDWVAKGAVTPVKNQRQCGSCWAFSSTGALEGQTFRARNKLISLSEQNLVDCSGKYGNHGCSGGWMAYSFQYIKDNRGIDTEEGYPYEARDSTCRYQESKKGATDSGFTKIRSGDENQLMQAVATVGPIAVAIDASHSSFHFYHEGIYSESQCHQPVDHAVLVVGYAKDSKTNSDYWSVKNSWGQTWGSQGYIKILKGRNMCQIASYACYPLV